MSEDDVRQLALLVPVPKARDLPGARERVIREHLMDEMLTSTVRGPRRFLKEGRSRRPVIAVIAAAGIAAAAITYLVIPANPPSGPAYTLLSKIATAAYGQPGSHVRDSEFEYVRSEEASSGSTNGGPFVMDKLHEAQTWQSVSDICRTGLAIENGQRTPLTALPMIGNKIVSEAYARKHMGFTGCGRGPLGAGATYRLLESLPLDPRTLLGMIYRASQGTGTGPDSEAFVTIGDIIRNGIMPPRTAAALYRAAALVPGITVIDGVKNAVGRPGIAISRVDGPYRDEWIFDPATLQFIGERQYYVRTGALIGESAILQSAFVSGPGQLP